MPLSRATVNPLASPVPCGTFSPPKTRQNTHMATPSDLLTTAAAAELIQVHRNTLRSWITNGSLRAWRCGIRSLRVSRADVLAMLKPVQHGEPPAEIPEKAELERAEMR